MGDSRSACADMEKEENDKIRLIGNSATAMRLIPQIQALREIRDNQRFTAQEFKKIEDSIRLLEELVFSAAGTYYEKGFINSQVLKGSIRCG